MDKLWTLLPADGAIIVATVPPTTRTQCFDDWINEFNKEIPAAVARYQAAGRKSELAPTNPDDFGQHAGARPVLRPGAPFRQGVYRDGDGLLSGVSETVSEYDRTVNFRRGYHGNYDRESRCSAHADAAGPDHDYQPRQPGRGHAGSSFALYHALSTLGKRVCVVNNDKITPKYCFLSGGKSVLKPQFEPDFIVAVDVGDTSPVRPLAGALCRPRPPVYRPPSLQ